VDARGFKCPRPVIETRAALERRTGPFVVLVDNRTAVENVGRFARSRGCTVGVEECEGGYRIEVTPPLPGTEGALTAPEPGAAERLDEGSRAPSRTVIFISSDEIGGGDPELGRTLMKLFLYSSAESETPPDAMVFMNAGVHLVTENEETVSHISRLVERGSEVLVCGTCLDYYGLTDRLKVGRVSNMYEIQSVLVGAGRLVSI
jgi:selenium metabolism protein YedF